MRVATLDDLHGNLRALEAVLQEIPAEATIVVGGDICAGGTHPSETLERLRLYFELTRPEHTRLIPTCGKYVSPSKGRLSPRPPAVAPAGRTGASPVLRRAIGRAELARLRVW
jgi:hypothetical protein